MSPAYHVLADCLYAIISQAIDALQLPIDEIERSERGSGMHVTCTNGYTVSIQWNDASYSNVGRGREIEADGPTVEVGAWDRDATWVRLGQYEDVAPYQTLGETLAIVERIALL